MHPAPSVIAFTVLSGMGFGLFAFLGAGYPAPAGWAAFVHWGLAYGLAVAGLLASTFHLGNPQRALLAFTQWRSSWLSREAWASVATLLVVAPVALSDWLGLDWPRWIGFVGAFLSAATILCTAMIYAQMKTVPRWNHWTTPALFGLFALTGGALLAGHEQISIAGLIAVGACLTYSFWGGADRFATRGHSLASATGLGEIGQVSVFEQPHTGGNYLMREMIHVVGRKHAAKLQWIAVGLASVLPLVCLMVLPSSVVFPIAVLAHVMGALTSRWLFFAQAEHVVGLYYGKR
jgi:sulfite dehydrogenase (quinone) subunit SoeC